MPHPEPALPKTRHSLSLGNTLKKSPKVLETKLKAHPPTKSQSIQNKLVSQSIQNKWDMERPARARSRISMEAENCPASPRLAGTFLDSYP
jgi:hypothetical protein